MSRVPAGYKVVIDVSYHQKIDYKLVSQFIDGAIVRCAFGTWADPAFKQHYEGFMAEGKPVASYQWFRPDQDVKAQIEVAKVLLDATKIGMLFSDQEQHGLYSAGLIIPPYYSGDRLSTLGQSHVTGLGLHGFEMGVYTRATWISQWAKPMLKWLFNYNQWLASWPFAKGAMTLSWQTLLDTWAPTKFSPYLTTDWPVGAPAAGVWQWSGDKFILPGITNTQNVPRAVDLNYVSETVLARFLKQPPPPPPPPVEPPPPPPLTVEERVTKLEETVKSAYSEIDQLQQVARTKGWEV